MAVSKYTSAENQWICEHLDDGTYTELAEMFRETFGRDVSASGLRKQVQRLGLAGTKHNSSYAVKGCCKFDTYPIGTEYTNAEGIVMIKVADRRSVYNKKLPGGYTEGGNWRKKAYHNWEQAYGSIQEWKRLIYLDGNTQNCDVSNLYFTDLRVQLRINTDLKTKGNRELTLAAIKYWELYYAIKEVDNDRT